MQIIYNDCQCKTYQQRKYINSPKDLTTYLNLTKKLVETNVLTLTSDVGENTDHYQQEFSCPNCQQEFVLEWETAPKTVGSFGLKSKIISEYIIKLDYLCRRNRVPETYRGKDIYNSKNKGEWVYFECYFDEHKIRQRFNLPDTVEYYEYNGMAAGQESGFIDHLTNDAVLGNHPMYGTMRHRKKLT